MEEEEAEKRRQGRSLAPPPGLLICSMDRTVRRKRTSKGRNLGLWLRPMPGPSNREGASEIVVNKDAMSSKVAKRQKRTREKRVPKGSMK